MNDQKQIAGFWNIPTNWEICRVDMGAENYKKRNLPGHFEYNLGQITDNNKDVPPEFFVNDQKSLLAKRGFKMTALELKDSEQRDRFVDFREAFHYETSLVTRYLQYFKQV